MNLIPLESNHGCGSGYAAAFATEMRISIWTFAMCAKGEMVSIEKVSGSDGCRTGVLGSSSSHSAKEDGWSFGRLV